MAEVMSVIGGVFQALYKSTLFLYYRQEIKYLLENVQKTVDERMRILAIRFIQITHKFCIPTEIANGRPTKHFLNANKISRTFVRNYSATMIVAAGQLAIGPLILLVTSYWQGTITDDVIRLPFEVV